VDRVCPLLFSHDRSVQDFPFYIPLSLHRSLPTIMPALMLILFYVTRKFLLLRSDVSTSSFFFRFTRTCFLPSLLFPSPRGYRSLKVRLGSPFSSYDPPRRYSVGLVVTPVSLSPPSLPAEYWMLPRAFPSVTTL